MIGRFDLIATFIYDKKNSECLFQSLRFETSINYMCLCSHLFWRKQNANKKYGNGVKDMQPSDNVLLQLVSNMHDLFIEKRSFRMVSMTIPIRYWVLLCFLVVIPQYKFLIYFRR